MGTTSYLFTASTIRTLDANLRNVGLRSIIKSAQSQMRGVVYQSAVYLVYGGAVLNVEREHYIYSQIFRVS